MANRRFAVHEIRNIIVRMRLGESDRQLAKAGLIGRSKAAKIRSLANERGWLDKSVALPDNLEIESAVLKPCRKQTSGSLVKPYANQVQKWIEEGITATVIHRNLVNRHGFRGSYQSVKRYAARFKQKKPVTIILDFNPGEAAQVDFGTGPVLMNTRTGECIKTWFFVMTLAYSRHQYLEFVLNQKVATWLGCHRRAFEFFGGIPVKVIIDNPKCAITKACYHDPEVQRSYTEFAEGYGFIISPCPVADPQKKGIVESGVKYVKKNFLPLLEPRDLSDLNRQAHTWVMETAGNRIHGTTRQRPLSSFTEMEKDMLKPLPDVAPEVLSWTRAKLHGNCHVQFEKCYYSAPFKLVHQTLWLRSTEKTLQIYHENELVAAHQRLISPGQRSTVRDHLPPEAQAYLMADPQWCLKQASRVGERCLELMEIQFSDRVLDKLRSMQGLLRLGGKYGKKRLEAACARAIDHGRPTYGAVKQILSRGLDQETVSSEPLDEVYSGQARFIRQHSIIQ